MIKSISVFTAYNNALVSLILLLSLAPVKFELVEVVSHFWPYLVTYLTITSILGLVLGRLSLNLLCLGVASYLAFLVLTPFNEQVESEDGESLKLKVISFNVLEDNTERAGDIANFLAAQDADFVFVQEAEGLFPALDDLRRAYPFQTDRRRGCEPATSCDTIILSKHPLDNIVRPLTPAGRDRFVVATTKVGGRSLTLAGLHLTKPLEAGQQAAEIEVIGRYVRDLPRPLIAAGDFNAAPWSKALARFKRLADVRYPYGYRPTWPIWLRRLGLPIDHVLLSGDLSVLEARTQPDPMGSNHLPLLTTLAAGAAR